MAISRGQQSNLAEVGSGAGVTATWSTNPTAGSSILLIVQCAAGAPATVVDNGVTPTTFTLDVNNPTTDGTFLYRANNITLPASGQYSVTASGSSGHTYQAWGEETIGQKPGPPTATNTNSGTGTAISTGAAAPASAGGIVFAAFTDDTGLNPQTITFNGSSPQVEETRNTNGSSYVAMAIADALTGSSQTFSWTIGDSQPWATVIAAYDADITEVDSGSGGLTAKKANTVGPNTSPIFGADHEGPWSTVQTAIGVQLRGYRTYNFGTIGVAAIPAAYPGTDAGPIPSGVPDEGVVLSCYPNQSNGSADVPGILAGTYDTVLATYFATVPSGAYITLWEEGEADSNGQANFTSADYIAAHNHVYSIFKANAPAGAKYGQIFSTASAFSGNSGFPLSDWICTAHNGGSDLDFYGLDVYPNAATDTVTGHMSVVESHFTTAQASPNAEMTVAESGTFSWWTQGTRESWFSGVWNYAVTNGYKHALTWWNPNSSDTDTVWPPTAAVITEMTNEATASIPSGDSGSSGTVTYTLFNQITNTGSHGDDDASSQVLGLRFTLSESCTVNKIWFYSYADLSGLPVTIGIFDRTSQTLIPGTRVDNPTWSGAAGSGWISYTYGSPVQLGAGDYVAAAWNTSQGLRWYSLSPGWWATNEPSGITNGPISCATQPDSWEANASAFDFPPNDFGDYNIWIDVEVSKSAGGTSPSGSGGVTASKPSLSGSGNQSFTGAGAVTVSEPSLDGSGVATFAGSGNASARTAELSGAGSVELASTGSITAPKTEAAATGTLAFSGSGAAAVSKPSLSGSGGGVFNATGHITTSKPSLSGTGTETDVFTGSGGVFAKSASSVGTGTEQFAGSSFSGLKKPIATGAGFISDGITRPPADLGGTLISSVYSGTVTMIDPALSGAASIASYSGTVTQISYLGTVKGWTMQIADITLMEHNDETIDVVIKKNGTNLNLTGYTIEVYLKTSSSTADSDPSTIKLSTTTGEITITDAANGGAEVVVPSIDLSDTTKTFWRLDVVLSGKRNTVFSGNVTVTPL